MQRLKTRRTTMNIAVATGLVVLLSSLVVVAQRGGGAGGAAAAKPLVPVAASSLALHPELYMGQTVAMTATVERLISKTAFSVDQDPTKSQPKDILVLAPTMNGTLKLNTYVTVVGDVVRFDPADIARRAKGYTLDLPADIIEKYRGQPAVLATSVVDAQMTDLAKPVAVPPTPAEDALDRVMKQVSPTFADLRASLDKPDAASAHQLTAKLKPFFGDTQTFFKDRGTADAMAWALDAQHLVDTIDTAAAGGKWDDAKTAAGTLNSLCGTCHTAHRVRQDDGTYRVK